MTAERLQQFRRVRRQDWPVGRRLCPSCVAAIWADGVEVTEADMDEWPQP